ncbi:carbohydrate ABC transporter permease [Salinibacterium sp. SWN1162]|uniref:carbohydrate ABC transporter permease n=1 Tax=Salinibacterium sp. SWN1162 TaxID=2792053 RepID=UPI0018CEC512|nr:sugar ABC transporter permease [Salinibacterium sp. SWN1162]MBH0008391.1 sugar ABC transporter permease [Salinibacterium sp. SWN1162]
MTANIFGSSAAPKIGFYPAFIFVAFFSLIPAVATLGLSFTDITGVTGVPINWVGLDNYVRFFSPSQVSETSNALINTLLFAVGVSAIQNVVAFFVAVLLNRQSKFALFTRSVVFLPTVLGVTVVGMLWTLIFNPIGGPAQSFLSLFGLRSSFFGDPNLALLLCIFVQIWMTLGYASLIYTAGLQAIPQELYEAADIDGANVWQRLKNITVPMIAPSITTNVLISIIGSLQSFQLIYVLTGALNDSTSVLSLLLYRVGFGIDPDRGAEQGYASAISIIQFMFVAVIALGSFWFLRRRENQL